MSQPIGEDQTQSAKAAAPARSRLRRWSMRILRLLLICYLLVAALAYFFQRQLTFPGSCTPNAVARYAPPAGATPLILHTENGTQINAVFYRGVRPRRPTGSQPGRPPHHPLLLRQRPGAGYAQYEIDLFRRCGANVLAGDYPGYGLSAGQASEEGCYALADTLWDWAQQAPEVDKHRIVVVGWSLGGAVAIDLTQRRPVAGLMTVSAFTTIGEPAAHTFWFLPTSLLLKYRFDSLHKIRSIDCPTLIAHGTADTFVPYEMSFRLHDASPARWKRHLALPKAGHNDAFTTGYAQIAQALPELLNAISASQTPTSAPAMAISEK